MAPDVQDESARDDQVDGDGHLCYFSYDTIAKIQQRSSTRTGSAPAEQSRRRAEGNGEGAGRRRSSVGRVPHVLSPTAVVHIYVAQLLQYGLSPEEDMCLAPSHRRFQKSNPQFFGTRPTVPWLPHADDGLREGPGRNRCGQGPGTSATGRT